MNKTCRNVLDIVWYFILFVIIQILMMAVVPMVWDLCKGATFNVVLKDMKAGPITLNTAMLIIASAVSSVLTLAVFWWRKYNSVSRSYIAGRPWATLLWVVFLALGTLLPSIYIDDVMSLELPSSTETVLQGLMSDRWGYLAVGILAPLVEEVVFRGAILRTLLKMFDHRWHWIAILISALIFGGAHGNLPQFVHATLIGLLLGWMYYRTDSIVPGVVFHWVNNTVIYVIYNLMPQVADSRNYADIFQGNERAVWMSLLFSLCIFLPSLFQLNLRLKKANQ